MNRRTPIAAALFALTTSPAIVHADPVPAPAPAPLASPAPVHQVDIDGTKNNFAPGDINVGKLHAELRDIPQSVTVVNKELMESQGANSLAEALRNVSGITLGAAEGGQIGNNINLNGFSARTDIYLDGFRDRGQYYRDTFSLDAVEVLMGPSSMLFGRGSTGGVINQVSKKPVTKDFTELQGSVSTNGQVRGTFDINTPLSETSAVRIMGMAQGGDATTRDLSNQRDAGIAPSIKWGMNTPTEITLSALLQKNHDEPDWGVLPLNGKPVQVDRNAAYGLDSDRTISTIANLNNTIEHKLTPTVTLRNQVQFNSVKTDAVETAPLSIGTVSAAGFTALPASGAGNLPLSSLSVRRQSRDREISDYSIFNQSEIIAKVTAGQFTHDLIGGIEVGHDGYDNQGYYRQGNCNGVPLNKPGSTTGVVDCLSLTDPTHTSTTTSVKRFTGNRAGGSANTVAAYLNDTWTISPNFKLTGGLRYDRFAASISNSINKVNTPGSTALAGADQTVGFTSVRLGGIWQPDRAQSYYVSYGTSFNPSLEQLTGTAGQQNLDPEKNHSYELGGKWELADNKLDASAAVFQITKENARNQISPGVYDLVGKVRVDGFRTDLSGRVNKQLQLSANYTYLDARVISAVDGTNGLRTTNTPQNSFTGWLTYDLTPRWEVGGGPVYMSERFANSANTVRVGGFTRWDATVAYNKQNYTVRLNLFNLTDKMYYDNLIPSDGGRAVPGTGRSAMLSLTYRM